MPILLSRERAILSRSSRGSGCRTAGLQIPASKEVGPYTGHMDSDERAEQLMGQLHHWAMEAIARPRGQRHDFIVEVAGKYYKDAVRNGLSASHAEDWRMSVEEWLESLVEVIETSGGAGGGHA